MIKQKGFTLVEMMIAFTLSAVLVLGLFQIFTSNKQAFTMQDGMARMQESGRVSMELLSRDMRSAGYLGCATGVSGAFENHVDATKYTNSEVKQALSLFDGDNGIIGFNNVTAIAAGSDLDGFGLAVGTAEGQVVSGTDVLILQGAEACAGGKVTDGGTGTAQLKIQDAQACGLEQGKIVVVSNCSTAEAFGISSNADQTDTLAHGSNWNIEVKLTGNYENDSYIYTPTSVLYYVGNGASGEPALFMKTLVDENAATNAYNSLEIAEGVEDFQVLFGEDTDGDSSANRYLVPETAGIDMNEVVAIRTRLLVRSQDGLTQTNQTYVFNGATVTAGDNRMRVAYESTHAIRNRVR